MPTPLTHRLLRYAPAAALVGVVFLSSPGIAADSGPGTWSVAAQMPAARTEIGGIALNGKIYVAGGQEMGRANSTLFQVFDPITKDWKTLAPLPEGASHIGITALDGKIYVAGGFTVRPHNNPIDRFAVYDPATDRWQILAPIPRALGSVSLAGVQGKIHALGGRMQGEVTVDMHAVYDPVSGTWTAAAPLSGPRDHMGVLVVDGRIHVIAGRNNDDPSDTGLHEVYDPATNTWSRLAPLPVARSGGAAVYYRGKIFYYGGECRTTPLRGAYALLDAYDPNTDRWSRLPAPPAGLHAEAGAVVGDSFYILGGATSCGSDRPSLAVYRYN